MIMKPAGKRFSLEQKLCLRREILRNGGSRRTPGESALFRQIDKIFKEKMKEVK